jgi:hypothetical protein
MGVFFLVAHIFHVYPMTTAVARAAGGQRQPSAQPFEPSSMKQWRGGRMRLPGRVVVAMMLSDARPIFLGPLPSPSS